MMAIAMMWSSALLLFLAVPCPRGALSFRTTPLSNHHTLLAGAASSSSPPSSSSSSSSSSSTKTTRGGGGGGGGGGVPRRRSPPHYSPSATRRQSSSSSPSSSSSSSSRDDDYDDGTEKKEECDDCPSSPTTDPPPPPPPPIPRGGTADNNDPHGGGGGPALLLLQPYLPALDPAYPARGPVGVSGKFVISRSGPPTREELSNDNMLMIVRSECTDLEVNTLVWKCLGYRFDADGECWDAGGGEVFPKWRESYPHPPDLLGMRRVYSRDVDAPSLRSNQALVRSIPVEHKQSLKTHLNPLGFTGFKLKELTPNKTRRAQCANWLIFYREELFGYTVEELRERRRSRRAAEDEAAEAMRRKEAEEGREGGATTEEWKPPVEEVF